MAPMFARALSWPTGLERYRPAIQLSSAAVGAILVAFHGWLLASQFADGRLAEPWLLARWVVAAGLVASLAALRRTGASIWGRKGVAIWVLAALLHGPAVLHDYGEAPNGPALPEVVATVVLQIAAVSTTLALGFWILGTLLTRAGHPQCLLLLALAFPASDGLAPGFSPPFSPRPPPRA